MHWEAQVYLGRNTHGYRGHHVKKLGWIFQPTLRIHREFFFNAPCHSEPFAKRRAGRLRRQERRFVISSRGFAQ